MNTLTSALSPLGTARALLTLLLVALSPLGGCGGQLEDTAQLPPALGGGGTSAPGGAGGGAGLAPLAGAAGSVSGGAAGVGAQGGSVGVGAQSGTAGAGAQGGAGSPGGPCTAEGGVTCGCGDDEGVVVCSTGKCVCPGTDEFQLLAWYQAAIVGHWQGTMKTPWNEPYSLEMRFEENGHYLALGGNEFGAAPLYYGPQADTPANVYELEDVKANKKALGRLQIGPVGDPFWLDLHTVGFSADLAHVSLEIWNQEYGPMNADLSRVTP